MSVTRNQTDKTGCDMSGFIGTAHGNPQKELTGKTRAKKWRRGWELNPHDTVLQTAPLAIRAPRLGLRVIYLCFPEKQVRNDKKIPFF